jgi:hypothetical protein
MMRKTFNYVNLFNAVTIEAATRSGNRNGNQKRQKITPLGSIASRGIVSREWEKSG